MAFSAQNRIFIWVLLGNFLKNPLYPNPITLNPIYQCTTVLLSYINPLVLSGANPLARHLTETNGVARKNKTSKLKRKVVIAVIKG